jgi:hypothetical protein
MQDVLNGQLVPTPSAAVDLDDRSYFALPRLSASGAKTLLKSPARYRYERDNPAKPTAAMEFGTMMHALVLEPHVFASRYALAPDVDRRTKEGKVAAEQWAANNPGRIAVPSADWERVHAMARAVEQAGGGDLMVGGDMERAICWERDGVPLKAKLDCLGRDCIVDLKTTSAEDEDSIQRAAWSFGYHISAAAYQEAAEVLTGRKLPKVFVFVTSTAPHDVVILEASDDFIARGRVLWDKAVRLYAACAEFDDWPGMGAQFSGGKLQPPKWA